MTSPFLIFFLLSATFFVHVAAECPNACSSHGRCGAFDACQCYRNWMSNDCSERICQFGLAHVDTPKGDLDASGGSLYGPKDHTATSWNVVVGSDLYPYGTNEQFPNMVDSDYTGNNPLSIIQNTAHYYQECSNKGICDRSAGTCTCIEGYEGSACSRASCPSGSNGLCSGHGTCKSIKELAKLDYGNVYSLWDQDATMGCYCDAGYYGPDCSMRRCKFGYDPLYYDDTANVRYSNWTFAIYQLATDSENNNNLGNTWDGNYSITFYDAHGEDWETIPIGITETCDSIITKLESIPNNVIKANSVLCSFDKLQSISGAAAAPYDADFNIAAGTDGFPIFFGPQTSNLGSSISQNAFPASWTDLPAVKAKFTLAFPANAGKLKQPKINYYLDGSRPTLTTGETKSTLSNWVFPNGFSGENDDFVPDLCEGVSLVIKPSGFSAEYVSQAGVGSGYYGFIGGLDVQELKAFKRCLGGSDKIPSNNVDVYNWDYGDVENPHLIKLVDMTTDPVSRLCDTTQTYVSGTNHQVSTTVVGLKYCLRNSPPGFYAVVIFDNSNSVFKILNRPFQDYASTTVFSVYTTTGIMQQVNPNVATFTTSSAGFSDADDIASLYQPYLYTTNSSTLNPATSDPANAAYNKFFGQVDCETSRLSSSDSISGALGTFVGGGHDCIDKGDYVIAINTALTFEGLRSNPKYINIYQVKKIGRENRMFWNHPDSEKIRHKITLDMSMNARYNYITNTGLSSPNADTAATLYKFYPPGALLNDVRPTTYAGECSTRGVCDTTSGLCTCFGGYTGDNCGIMNALAA